ncbi:enoyl-CoA hydratase-related protein, partial [Chloroflexota bacterium]
WNTTKPVIAQVHGHCVAGGNDLAGQCDIIIAAEDAKIMLPQIRRIGVALPLNMFAYNAGLQWAKMLVFTGDSITGKKAEEIGLVAKAIPANMLDEEVTKLAMRIALVPYELLALNKIAINRVAEEMGLRNVLNFGAELDAISHFTEPVQDFKQIAAKKGLKNAIAENEAQFRTLPGFF